MPASKQIKLKLIAPFGLRFKYKNQPKSRRDSGMKIMPNVLLLMSLLILHPAFSAAQEIELLASYQNKAIGLEQVSGLTYDSVGHLVAIDSKLGVLMRIKVDGSTDRWALGNGNVFKSNRLTGVSQFNQGYIVSNSGDGKVAIINAEGQSQQVFGEKGRRLGMLNTPQSISHSINDRVYIADPSQSYISIYNRYGVYLSSIGNKSVDPKQRLKKPSQVAVDALERVYVLEAGSSARISVYQSSGELVKQHTTEALKALFGGRMDLAAIAVDPAGRLFLADNRSGKIMHYDWQNNTVLFSFGSRGKGPGQYRKMTALALSLDNKIAVADTSNKKIDVYQLAGEPPADYARAWLPNIGLSESIPMPCSSGYRMDNESVLCLNSKIDKVGIYDIASKSFTPFDGKYKDPIQASYTDDAIAVVSRYQVSVFTRAGKLLSQFGKSGSRDGQLGRASDIYIRDRKIYVAESSNRRVQIFSMKGVHLGKFPLDKKSTLFGNPVAVAVDSNNNIYVADDKRQKVLVFSKQHKFLYAIGEPVEAPGRFKNIVDLEFDSDNNLYVLASTELNAQTVQVFSGAKLIFEFGSSSKKGSTAIAKGTSLSISLTQKTLVSIFDGDAKNPRLMSVNYLQMPAQIGGVSISGGVATALITWQRPPGNYVSHYRIYASMRLDDEFKLIEEVTATNETIQFDRGAGYQFYKISGVSGFGSEGPMSRAREDVFQRAYRHYQAEEYTDSIEILSTALSENPDQFEPTKYLGLSYLKLKKYASANEYFKLMSAHSAHKIEGLNLQIEALFENGDYSQALALVQDVIEASENDIEPYLYCGKLSLKMADPIGAVTCLEDALKIDADSPRVNLLLGEAYITAGAVESGIVKIEMAVAAAADSIPILIQAGQLYADLNEHEKAQQQYTAVLQIDDNHTDAQLGLARSYLKTNELAGAKNIAIKLAGKKATENTGHYVLGLIALENESYGEAVISLGRVTRADPQNSSAWSALSDVYLHLDQPAKQLKALQNAINVPQPDFSALKKYAKLLVTNQQFDAATAVLDQALALSSTDYESQIMAASAYYEVKKYAAAFEHARDAHELDDKMAEPLGLLAKISHKRGKTGSAIGYAKDAIAIKADDAKMHILLGELYLDNNLYAEAKASFEQAILVDKANDKPHRLLGLLYSNRRLFDEAIKAFDLAVELNQSSENKLALDRAYANKKKSLEFSGNTPQLVLEDLNVSTIFSAAYKQYNDKPVGTIRVRNVGASDYGNLKVSFEIKGYMDFPTSQTIKNLAANQSIDIPLIAAFNNKVLDIDEDTGVQVEVKLSFVREGRNDNISVTRPMTIYGKNAIVWNNPEMIGSFVTPKDDSLRDFIRQIINRYKPARGPLSENLVTAMTVFDVLSAYGVKYNVDPNNPYSDLKSGEIDYVQFPRESLKLKSGDCDDLSVLLSASLENLGIETALLDVPGHLLMMFNTTISEQDQALISAQSDLLAIRDGEIWIPIEATMLAINFEEAWAEGARKYHEHLNAGSLNVIYLKDAWQTYPPVTLAKASYELALPDRESVMPIIEREHRFLLEKGLTRLVGPYRAMIENNPLDTISRMQVAIIYARYGLDNQAIIELDNILEIDSSDSAVYNNRGNIYLLRGDYQRAYEAYAHAERLDAIDPGIKLNLSLALYQGGERIKAQEKFAQAVQLDQAIAQNYTGFSKLLSN